MTYDFPIKVFDFFAGCGGTSIGFSNADMETVFALDNDKLVAQTFAKNFDNIELLFDFQFTKDNPLKSGDYPICDIKDMPTEALQSIIDSCQGH